jgi:hypothetical protein
MVSLDININKKTLIEILYELYSQKIIVKHHPLGFLRLMLTENSRLKPGFYLHVWPDVPLASQPSDYKIHNHIFDLESRVICGSLIDITYDVEANDDGGYYQLRAEHCNEFSELIIMPQKCICNQLLTKTVGDGGIYKIDKGTYHSTEIKNGYTATLMHKTNVDLNKHPLHIASSFSILDKTSFNPIHQDEAWSIIFELEKRWEIQK